LIFSSSQGQRKEFKQFGKEALLNNVE